jgi:hypothetical protein
VVFGAPEALFWQVSAECPEVILESDPSVAKVKDAVFLWCFCSSEKDLKRALPKLRKVLAGEGQLWISWPKKTSWKRLGLNPLEAVTEDAIRKHAFPRGLVDVKVCAVDPIWSGLKLVVRRENRKIKAGTVPKKIRNKVPNKIPKKR